MIIGIKVEIENSAKNPMQSSSLCSAFFSVLKHAEEVHWIFSIIFLQTGILAERWREELLWVQDSNHIVEEAGHHPSSFVSVKQSADRNTSKLGDGAHVLSCSLLHLHLSCPGVDQNSLSDTRGGAQNHLSLQSSVPWDLKWVEFMTQVLLDTSLVGPVNLVHNTLFEE